MAPKIGREQLAAEFHPVRNLDVSFVEVATFSQRKLWWLGPCGHEWEARMANRTASGSGCPYCANKAVLAGFNDMLTTHPEQGGELHPAKNGLITARDVTAGSNKKLWWLGPCGHEWEASPNARVFGGSGCPYCSGHNVIVGERDFATVSPHLTSQWSARNDLKPNQVAARSAYLAWWECERGHEWQAKVYSRTNGNNCPVCSNRKVMAGENDLPTLAAKLIPLFHPTKNTIQPTEIMAKSLRPLWWLGPCGHEWLLPPSAPRVTQCPYCFGRKLLVGFNDAATTNPELLAEVHPAKNSILLQDVTKGSKVQFWWMCSKGHEWRTAVHQRTGRAPTGCPTCAAAKMNYVSEPENEIVRFLNSLGLDPERSTRHLLRGNREVDIWVPEKKMAIEYNGLYYHTEAFGKGRDYHWAKWDELQAAGIQLLQIWEDDWLRNPDLIKRMLAHKLGLAAFVAASPPIGARKTKAESLNVEESKLFFNANHIQGFASGRHYLGLRSGDGSLVAAAVFRHRKNDEWELVRYATDRSVSGGFTKLLRYFISLAEPAKIITFSDHTVSDGKLYADSGFVPDGEVPPDYTYVSGMRREHKFGYRKGRFKRDSNLIWREGQTELELARANGLHRIWDAGKTRWVLTPSA